MPRSHHLSEDTRHPWRLHGPARLRDSASAEDGAHGGNFAGDPVSAFSVRRLGSDRFSTGVWPPHSRRSSRRMMSRSRHGNPRPGSDVADAVTTSRGEQATSASSTPPCRRSCRCSRNSDRPASTDRAGIALCQLSYTDRRAAAFQVSDGTRTRDLSLHRR
jgi:hypothetical protein